MVFDLLPFQLVIELFTSSLHTFSPKKKESSELTLTLTQQNCNLLTTHLFCSLVMLPIFVQSSAILSGAQHFSQIASLTLSISIQGGNTLCFLSLRMQFF